MKIFWRFLEEKLLIKIFIKSFLLKIFTRFSEEIQRRSSEEWNLREGLLLRSSWDLILQKIFAEFLRKTFWRFLEENILWRFWSKFFLQIIFKRSTLIFLWKIFKQFLPKIFLRFWIFERSSVQIFLRSTEDLLVFVLIFNFEKN